MSIHNIANPEKAIYEYLESKQGAHLYCHQIAAHFGWTVSHTSRQLLNLSRDMKIMVSLSRRDRSYYVPMKDQITTASHDHTPIKTEPLKVDKYRRELYRELAEARASIPSIG